MCEKDFGKEGEFFINFWGGYGNPSKFHEKYYDLYSQLTPDVDGTSLIDFITVFYKAFWPTWNRLLFSDYSESLSHQVYTIQHDSHLGKELVKKKQVKKDENK